MNITEFWTLKNLVPHCLSNYCMMKLDGESVSVNYIELLTEEWIESTVNLPL